MALVLILTIKILMNDNLIGSSRCSRAANFITQSGVGGVLESNKKSSKNLNYSTAASKNQNGSNNDKLKFSRFFVVTKDVFVSGVGNVARLPEGQVEVHRQKSGKGVKLDVRSRIRVQSGADEPADGDSARCQ